MKEYQANGKPKHRKERTINSDYDIISQFQSEFRGFAQYYLLEYNAHKLSGFKRSLELSLAYTLANKHKTTGTKSSRNTAHIAKLKMENTKCFRLK
jgi:hypothetical protein